MIDRRFYRREYDAARTLDAFNATRRHEVDLQSLSEHLTRVVQETRQPAHISLWLRPLTHATAYEEAGYTAHSSTPVEAQQSED